MKPTLTTKLNARPRGQSSFFSKIWIGVPITTWLFLLIIIPICIMLVTSFYIKEGSVVVKIISLVNYLEFFINPIYLPIFFRTLLLALLVSLTSILLGYPLAYLVSRKVKRFRNQLYMLVIVPLWVSYLVRIVAWRTILGRVGVLNTILLSLKIIDEPLSIFIYSPFAVYVALIYIALPYVFISIFNSLEKIPKNLLDASADLGANSFNTFLHVILPLSMPGVISGFTLAFVIALGDYIIPQQLGGLNGMMFGNLIVTQFGYAYNWPLGAALGFIMFTVAVVILLVSQKFGSSEGFLE
ncbi:MAG: ABC transporter permease [Atribacterota bacterium]|jgi:spermidine/putrescine transport system permease protein|nr:ABC transporter permease [Atribacterota bacterium]HHT09898.1 ABC transporter permease [Candidatus Atribacteria bacterium]